MLICLDCGLEMEEPDCIGMLDISKCYKCGSFEIQKVTWFKIDENTRFVNGKSYLLSLNGGTIVFAYYSSALNFFVEEVADKGLGSYINLDKVGFWKNIDIEVLNKLKAK